MRDPATEVSGAPTTIRGPRRAMADPNRSPASGPAKNSLIVQPSAVSVCRVYTVSSAEMAICVPSRATTEPKLEKSGPEIRGAASIQAMIGSEASILVGTTVGRFVGAGVGFDVGVNVMITGEDVGRLVITCGPAVGSEADTTTGEAVG